MARRLPTNADTILCINFERWILDRKTMPPGADAGDAPSAREKLSSVCRHNQTLAH